MHHRFHLSLITFQSKLFSSASATKIFACSAKHQDDDASPDDLPEAVKTLEEVERTARRVLGGAHPRVVEIEETLRDARAALRAREDTQP